MRLRWTKAARRDRELIYEYIEIERPDAALRLDERFDDRAEQLARLPLMGREGRIFGTRELSIPNSNYLLVYQLDGDVLWILRVIHTAQSWPEEPDQ